MSASAPASVSSRGSGQLFGRQASRFDRTGLGSRGFAELVAERGDLGPAGGQEAVSTYCPLPARPRS